MVGVHLEWGAAVWHARLVWHKHGTGSPELLHTLIRFAAALSSTALEANLCSQATQSC